MIEAEQVIKQIVRQLEKETTIAKKQATAIRALRQEKGKHEQIINVVPPQVKPFEIPSRLSSASEKITATDKIRVFIIDRDLLSSYGLVTCLSQSYPIEVISKSDYFTEDTILMIEELVPNVVLVDIDLPSHTGLDLARWITRRSPKIPVIVLTPYENNEQIFGALKSGAAAYLTKHTHAEEIVNVIQRVYKGEHIIDTLIMRPVVAQRVLNQFHGAEKATGDLTTSLSPQEIEVLSHFANYYSCNEVAYAMVMSDETIRSTLASIVSKLIAADSRQKLLIT